MKEFNLIRHGEKLEIGEERKPLKDSGLTSEQQAKWSEAVKRLELEDPELAYEALPKIEKLGQEIYDSLPEKALLVFVSTDTPRTKLTADLLSCEIINISKNGKKDIAVLFLWEPPEEETKPDSLKNVMLGVKNEVFGDIMMRMKAIMEQDIADNSSFQEYIEKGGNKTFPMEQNVTWKAINEDIASEDSTIKKRGLYLREHFEKMSEQFKDEDRPVFFYGLCHHSALVALDTAFNEREKYDSVKDIPNPLDLWSANLKEKNE
ncbi:MAG: hypothetical protein V1804_03455 [Patescibacteria group bacterium]